MSVAAQNWGPGGEVRPELEVDGPAQQRRLTVFFRLLLLIPHFIVFYLLSIAAYVVMFIAWFAALILGRLPDGIADFLAGYVRYMTRLQGSYMLLVDQYPPFALGPADYPVRIAVEPTRLNRLAVFFRWLLVIPAALLSGFVSLGWGICSLVIWLVVLIAGRMPAALFEASAAVLRYQLRLWAYWLMLTPAYPKGLFGDGSPASTPRAGGYPPASPYEPSYQPQGPPDGDLAPTGPTPGGGPGPTHPHYPAQAPSTRTRPLLLSSSGWALVVLFLVAGVLYFVGLGVAGAVGGFQSANSAVALQQLNTAYEQTNSSLAPVRRQVSNCGISPDPGNCYRQATRQLADGFQNFSGDIAAIEFPGYAQAEADSLQSALNQAVATLRDLSVATTAAEFNQILIRDDYMGQVQDVQNAYQALATELREHI